MSKRWSVILLSVLGAATAATPAATDPEMDARIAPAEIELGQTSSLTITASGDEQPKIAAPQVPGLSFTPVGQSRRVESVNGVIRSSFSVTYQVTPQHPGTYVIASVARGTQPLVLKVDAAGATAAGGVPATASGGPTGQAPGGTHATDGPAAIVKLLVPTHDIYVGQSVPVDIEVDTQDGVVASLNGLPTLNGDAFTLDKLSPEPEHRGTQMIDGKPYTVFTWHSVLSAIKPGNLSLSLDTPMTVRVPVPHPAARFLDDSTLEEVFDDPAFQGFFGANAEKEVTVSSAAVKFSVLDLPQRDRPADFSGAVGQFTVASSVSERAAAAGDPLTLRLTVSGEGNFDRLNSPMLTEAAPWKTYKPTAKFTSADKTAYRGDKVFEQPVVATVPGRQVLPPLSFSYFDPVERRYQTLRTAPLSVDIGPPAGGAPKAAGGTALDGRPAPLATAVAGRDALRPDHALEPGAAESLVPVYFQPPFLALPAGMVAAMSGAWLWMRRRERRATAGREAQGAAGADPQLLLAAMDRATESGNAEDFFSAARAVLQRVFASRWQIPPDAVTLAEVDTRLGPDSEVRRLFALADEVRYSDRRAARLDLRDWKRIVLGQVPRERLP